MISILLRLRGLAHVVFKSRKARFNGQTSDNTRYPKPPSNVTDLENSSAVGLSNLAQNLPEISGLAVLASTWLVMGRCGMKNFTSIFTICLATLAISPTSKASQPAVGADRAACVFHDLVKNETCPVFSKGRALEFLSMGEDAVIFVESEKSEQAVPGTKPERTSLVASSRVEDSVLMDEIDEDEGKLLEREVQELSGARYELPTSRRELKKQLGFPENAEIAREDWAEIIRVHAETVLSISAVASRFLLEQIGLVAAVDPALLPTEKNAAPEPPHESDPVVVETH